MDRVPGFEPGGGGSIPSRGTNTMNDEEVNKSYFPVSRPISKEDFDRIPLILGSDFIRGKNKDITCSLVANTKGCYVSLSSETENISSQIPQEKLILYTIENEGKRLIYPRQIERPSPVSEKRLVKPYYVDGLKPRQIESRNVQVMTIEDLAGLIKETPGKGILFYTGAGISTAGEVPVWNMAQLHEALGVGDQDAKTFILSFEENPEDLITKLKHFRDTLFADASTPAHTAIAEIVKAKPGSVVFTENSDLKHEAEGSRLSAVHVGRQTNDFLDVRLRASEAKLLITVGLSKDDRAIINYLKKINPELRIVAINLVPTEYLDAGDAVVLGDCQEILPKVAQLVKSS